MKRFIGIICIVLLAAAFQSFGMNVKKDIRPPGCMELNVNHADLQLQNAVVNMVSMTETPVYAITAYAVLIVRPPVKVDALYPDIRLADLQIQLPDKTVTNSKATGLPTARAVMISNQADFDSNNLSDIRRLTCNTKMQLNRPAKTLLHSCPTIRYL